MNLFSVQSPGDQGLRSDLFIRHFFKALLSTCWAYGPFAKSSSILRYLKGYSFLSRRLIASYYGSKFEIRPTNIVNPADKDLLCCHCSHLHYLCPRSCSTLRSTSFEDKVICSSGHSSEFEERYEWTAHMEQRVPSPKQGNKSDQACGSWEPSWNIVEHRGTKVQGDPIGFTP